MHPPHPTCEWVEVGEDDEHVMVCGEPAKGFVTDATGRHHYACLEHAASVKAHAGSGEWQVLPAHPPARPYPESMP
jgi:hypothetical protein